MRRGSTPHVDRETKMKICFHSIVWIVVIPLLPVTFVVVFVMGESSFISE
jgi:hypothetical protein